MTLGERIHQLRLEHHLSQGDVAEAVDVSRQSVSKWENDGAVPDLDKLVKLSQLFGVSLDQLVMGQEEEGENAPPPPPQPATQPTGQRIVGVVLLCFGFLVGLLMALLGNGPLGFLFGVPFYLCGVVCLVARRYPGLWCGWGLFVLARMFMPWMTGFGSFYNMVRSLFRFGSIQWVILMLGVLALLLLVGRTAWCYGKKPLEPKREWVIYLAGGWVIWVLLQVFFIQNIWLPLGMLYIALDVFQLVLLSLVTVVSVRMVRGRKRP